MSLSRLYLREDLLRDFSKMLNLR